MRTLIAALAMMAMLVPVSAAIAEEGDEPLDAVIVEGSLSRLELLHQQIIESEDQFLERYNTLNSSDDFDVHCFRDAPLGTKIRQRHCQAVYEREARAIEAKEHVLYYQASLSGRPQPAIVAIEARKEAYQRDMIEVVRRNPELFKLLQQRQKLVEEYETLRRSVFRRQPPSTD